MCLAKIIFTYCVITYVGCDCYYLLVNFFHIFKIFWKIIVVVVTIVLLTNNNNIILLIIIIITDPELSKSFRNELGGLVV